MRVIRHLCVCAIQLSFVISMLFLGYFFFLWFLHRHIYRKWNENFFRECVQAYRDGRATADPASYWYQGELGFFDYYIIPLAKKLKKCGVFGVASDEYLNYAMRNRQEWQDRGREVVEEMMANVAPLSSNHDTEPETQGGDASDANPNMRPGGSGKEGDFKPSSAPIEVFHDEVEK